jgi:transcriptional regulator with XRE-family HTH domain
MTLKSARDEAELSQEGLSIVSGVSLSMISLLEAGKRSPSLRIAMKLSIALNVRPEELFPMEHGKIVKPPRKHRVRRTHRTENRD